MKELKVKYAKTKAKSIKLMLAGQINAYLKTLQLLTEYKKQMIAVRVNQ